MRDKWHVLELVVAIVLTAIVIVAHCVRGSLDYAGPITFALAPI
jgi:hypothetical protein